VKSHSEIGRVNKPLLGERALLEQANLQSSGPADKIMHCNLINDRKKFVSDFVNARVDGLTE
jgi:hypothetical protein